MNKQGRKSIQILEKRKLHLIRRIQESTKDLSFDKQEVNAIQWALDYIQNNEDILNNNEDDAFDPYDNGIANYYQINESMGKS